MIQRNVTEDEYCLKWHGTYIEIIFKYGGGGCSGIVGEA